MSHERTVVVVGASLAGLRGAESLRQEGFDGRIVVIGAEPHLPYDRPPLSKKLLSGEWEPDRIFLRKPDAISDLGLDLRLATKAVELDGDAREVVLDTGERVGFDGCVIATGAACRVLPNQPGLEGIYQLRTLDEALALRSALRTGSPRVCVIGAGFIGAEVAATARMLGCDVTIVEALEVPLVRGLGPQMGMACADIHGDHGVILHLGVGVAGFDGTKRVEAVRLADGTQVPADVVVVGVGVSPSTGWLESSGITIRDGVVCDEFLATSLAGVYAAGDIARWPNSLLGEEVRIEHWTNAAEQGALAAKNMMSSWAGLDPEPYAALPFFWSEQYDRRIQFLGRAHATDQVDVVQGSVADRSFVALYQRNGRLTAVLGMNQPKLTMSCRRFLLEQASFDDTYANLQRLA